MADTKISALTTDSTPDRTADYGPTYDASAAATKKVLLSNFGGLIYQTWFSLTLNPADATTYYFSPHPGFGLAAATTSHKTYIQNGGTVRRIDIHGYVTGLGSAETSTISFRLNNTTDTTISSTVVMNATPVYISNTGLSIAVVNTDYFNIKWLTPTWVTNPTGISLVALIWVA